MFCWCITWIFQDYNLVCSTKELFVGEEANFCEEVRSFVGALPGYSKIIILFVVQRNYLLGKKQIFVGK